MSRLLDGSLVDLKRELFAQNLAKGVKPPVAYVEAGFQGDSTSPIPYRLAKRHDIVRRVRELTEPILKKNRISAERLLDEYANLAFANMDDYFSEDEETGKPVFDYGACTRAMRAAIAELKVEEVSMGENVIKTTTTFKLADKLGAMRDLAKYLKLIGSEQVNVNVLNIENLKAPDRDALERAVTALLEGRQELGPEIEGDVIETENETDD
jgi:phage terminase small subunit